jgi:hypothetical protein
LRHFGEGFGEDFGGGSPGYRFLTSTAPEWKSFSPIEKSVPPFVDSRSLATTWLLSLHVPSA